MPEMPNCSLIVSSPVPALMLAFFPALSTFRVSLPAPPFSLAPSSRVPLNVSSPAPRSAVAFLPRAAVTLSLPAPVLMLFETVLRLRLSSPAPVLMLSSALSVVNMLISPSLLAAELRETSFRALFVLAEILKLPVPFTFMYWKSPATEPFTLAAPLLITSFSTLEVLGRSLRLKSARLVLS